MKAVMASDHRGIELKKEIKKIFAAKGWDIEDLGPYTDESVDYPDYAEKVCKKVREENGPLGILICGTGIGMSMAANKYRDIRAALCYNKEVAELTRMHNNANILVLSADYTDMETLPDLLTAFFETGFDGGRHERRINKFRDIN